MLNLYRLALELLGRVVAMLTPFAPVKEVVAVAVAVADNAHDQKSVGYPAVTTTDICAADGCSIE
jgi:hypothetical protein